MSDEEKPQCSSADVLCAPSLGGESFGMVLTEAFAAGTPVVASDIAGYRDVVRTASTGCSCRAATRSRSPRRCATSRWTPPAAPSSPPPRPPAPRYAWPRVAAEVLETYEDAIARPRRAARARRRASAACPPTASASRRAACLAGAALRAARAARWPRARRAPAGDRRGRRCRGGARDLALQRIGVDRRRRCYRGARLGLVALGLMCLSMVLRGVAWHAILRAALPARPCTAGTRCRAPSSAC